MARTLIKIITHPEDQTELDQANARGRIGHQTFVILDSHRIAHQVCNDADCASLLQRALELIDQFENLQN